MKLLVTGGSGFIGSALIRFLIAETESEVVNLDKLTYAAAPGALVEVEGNARYRFEHADVADSARVRGIFSKHRPDAVMHLAAESHVDRSIDGPGEFVKTNVTGTYCMLEAAREYSDALPAEQKSAFRFLHVSTDEVYGSLGDSGKFTEETRYDPASPYSATKAASDHLVRAWHRTYGLPVVVSNCSNNYGPFQAPEKFIPTLVISALKGDPVPVYGDGGNVRDWLHVEDHARALWLLLARGRAGETYNIGGGAERKNIAVAESVCDLVDALAGKSASPRRAQIKFVADRPGHDRRYAIDCGKIEREFGWRPSHNFETGLKQTAEWYLTNENWWKQMIDKGVGGRRLGLAQKTQP